MARMIWPRFMAAVDGITWPGRSREGACPVDFPVSSHPQSKEPPDVQEGEVFSLRVSLHQHQRRISMLCSSACVRSCGLFLLFSAHPLVPGALQLLRGGGAGHSAPVVVEGQLTQWDEAAKTGTNSPLSRSLHVYSWFHHLILMFN